MIMTNQIHWRSAHDSFTTDDPAKDSNISDILRRKVMAFSKTELLHGQNVRFNMALSACNSHWWPYSLYLRWMVGKDNQRMVKAIEKHHNGGDK